ncbi:MAG TPA: alpha-L-fucosidase [Clostridiales bacterium]|nr:alpha-L-fucosidase [Clostridiales bacterium]
MTNAYKATVNIVPSERQLNLKTHKFGAFVYFGMNTFTAADIGSGFTSPKTFGPEDFSAENIVSAVKSAGMTSLVLTVKHYDGFCLWPSRQTDYTIAESNWMDGGGDIVKAISDECARQGIAFGIYFPVWDKHEESYGSGEQYDNFVKGQLAELLTDYGDIFMVWLDHTAGKGNNGKIQSSFDWNGYYKLIRLLQPNAIIAGHGPDARDVGNHRGVCRTSEWSVVPKSLGPDENGLIHFGDTMKLDLGSRKAIKREKEFIWYPAVALVPMRPNWFYRSEDDVVVKTKDKIIKLYYNSVGANTALYLGVAVDKRGRIPSVDSQILKNLGKDLKLMFGYNLADSAEFSASSSLSELYSPERIKLQNGFWRPAEGDKKPELIIKLSEPDMFDKIVISENIANGQHVEKFRVYYKNEKNKWKLFYKGTVIGSERICTSKPVKSDEIKLVFEQYRDFFEIFSVAIN